MTKDLMLLIEHVWGIVDQGSDRWQSLTIDDKTYYYNGITALSGIRKIVDVPIKQFAKSLLNGLRLFPHKTKCNLIYFEILNGYSVFNVEKGQILKYVDGKLEPNFINNYRTVNKVLRLNTPTLRDLGKFGVYQYIVMDFIHGSQKIKWNSWKRHLSNISILMHKMYLRYGFTCIDAEEYFTKGLNRAKNQIRTSKYMKHEYYKVLCLLEKSISKARPKGEKLYNTFLHGDLVPNNVLLDKNEKYYLLDWDNGGIHNCFYDLFMQDFYFSDRKIWKDLLNANFTSNFNQEYFGGWGDDFLRYLSRSRINLNNKQIRLSILACLFEVAEKNFLRHQCVKWRNDGKIILKLVVNHLESIVN